MKSLYYEKIIKICTDVDKNNHLIVQRDVCDDRTNLALTISFKQIGPSRQNYLKSSKM